MIWLVLYGIKDFCNPTAEYLPDWSRNIWFIVLLLCVIEGFDVAGWWVIPWAVPPIDLVSLS